MVCVTDTTEFNPNFAFCIGHFAFAPPRFNLLFAAATPNKVAARWEAGRPGIGGGTGFGRRCQPVIFIRRNDVFRNQVNTQNIPYGRPNAK